MKPGAEVLDGRIPCCIVDCGRTFAIREGETESSLTVCRRHWNMLPKADRDDMKLLHRIIRKRPSPANIALYNRKFDAAIAAIEATVTGGPVNASIEAFLEAL